MVFGGNKKNDIFRETNIFKSKQRYGNKVNQTIQTEI
jgi:hypothetical protein